MAFFFEVEGIPVSVGHPEFPGCMSWESEPPKEFSVDRAIKDGRMIREEEFLTLVKELR
jgi:hypothetical protein